MSHLYSELLMAHQLYSMTPSVDGRFLDDMLVCKQNSAIFAGLQSLYDGKLVKHTGST